MEAWANYKNLHENQCKKLLFGILPHVYLIHYFGNSVTAPAFLQISSNKVEKLMSGENPNKSGG